MTCNAQPPCTVWEDIKGDVCTEWEKKKIGSNDVCTQYDWVKVFGNVCVAWKDVFKGQADDLTKCTDWDKVIDKWVNGKCTQTKKQDVYENQCQLVDVIDATSETGYRKVNQCQQVKTGEIDVCTQWEQEPVYKDVCKKYAKKDVWEQQCTKTENQHTGWSQVCSKTVKQDVFHERLQDLRSANRWAEVHRHRP